MRAREALFEELSVKECVNVDGAGASTATLGELEIAEQLDMDEMGAWEVLQDDRPVTSRCSRWAGTAEG